MSKHEEDGESLRKGFMPLFTTFFTSQKQLTGLNDGPWRLSEKISRKFQLAHKTTNSRYRNTIKKPRISKKTGFVSGLRRT